MKSKKLAKIIILILLVLIAITLIFSAISKKTNTACADTLENVADPNQTLEEVGANLDNFSLSNELEDSEIFKYISSELMPLFSGIFTAIMGLLALIVPYFKTVNKLKATQSAYTVVYDNHEKLIKLAEEFDSKSAKVEITEAVLRVMKEEFEKYDQALGKVLSNEEVMSAQVSTLVEGAKLAWKEAEGASLVLSKIPNATALENQAIKIEFLKSLIANELNVKKEELESRMNKELNL